MFQKLVAPDSNLLPLQSLISILLMRVIQDTAQHIKVARQRGHRALADMCLRLELHLFSLDIRKTFQLGTEHLEISCRRGTQIWSVGYSRRNGESIRPRRSHIKYGPRQKEPSLRAHGASTRRLLCTLLHAVIYSKEKETGVIAVVQRGL